MSSGTQVRFCRSSDREQADAWSKKDADGFYLRHFLHFYFNWDPRIHHQSPELEWKKKMRGSSFSMSATKCIERGRREHEDLVVRVPQLDVRSRSNASIDRHDALANVG